MFLTYVHPIVCDPFPEILIHVPCFGYFVQPVFPPFLICVVFGRRKLPYTDSFCPSACSTAKDSAVIDLQGRLRFCPLLHLWLFTYLQRKQGKYHIDFYTLPIQVTRDAILEICVCTVIVTWLRENHNKKIYLWSLPSCISSPLY